VAGGGGKVVNHPRAFAALVPDRDDVRALYDGCTFTEGPVWFADHGILVWSDIPADRMLAWTLDGHVRVFREPSSCANGNTRDRQGRLVTCEHLTRRVTRTEPDGTLTVIADRYQGRRLNSPNDVVVRLDGTIWFTDPDYGLRQNVRDQPKEQTHDNVFRFDPATGVLTSVVDDFEKPNGLAFSPDHRTLYVADSAVTEGPEHPSHIRAFRVDDDGRVSGGEVFATTVGIPDGMRVDTAGHLWASAGAGVNVYAPDGELLGRVDFPVDVTNVTFGSPGSGHLFVTAGTTLYLLRVTADPSLWP
jgi:gluconolactonase